MSPTETPALDLAVLACDGALPSSLAGPLDLLQVAQRLAELRQPVRPPVLRGRLVGARGVRSLRSGGLELGGIGDPDPLPQVLLVPGLMHRDGGDLRRQVAALQPEIALLRALHLKGVRLVAACSGTFLLAATGLLDGHAATTSWWLAETFRRSFPAVRLEPDRAVVDAGGFATAGASSAVLQLTLRLVGAAVDPQLMQNTARMLLLDAERQSQAPYVVQALVERPRDSMAEKVERFLLRELHAPLTVGRIAEHCGTSERSLLRHFQARFGESPVKRIQRLRVDRAKALLETTHLSLDEIVERCGYADVASFRKLFKRATALTPGDYRERFRLRAH